MSITNVISFIRPPKASRTLCAIIKGFVDVKVHNDTQQYYVVTYSNVSSQLIMIFNQIYSSRSVSNINSKYNNSITDSFPFLLMLKYLLPWNNGHIIYDVVSFCMEFEDESKYCVKFRIKPYITIRKTINTSKICKWCDNLNMNMIFSIWRSNFIAIWNLAGIFISYKPHFTLENTHGNSGWYVQ